MLGTALLAITPIAAADNWSFKSSEHEFTFSHGTRFVVTTDASKSTQKPDFHVRIYTGKKLLAQYPGFNFKHVIASPDESLFVGLSNHGIPGTAAAVFSRNGSLRLLAIHGVANFDYCAVSATTVRDWYDDTNPDVRFGNSGQLRDITLRDCHGQRVRLLEIASKAYGNALR